MSVTQIARAYQYAAEHDLAPPRRLVLYVMADAADDDGRLWHGQQRLRHLTGLSISTIRKAIREFEVAGILTTQTRLRSEGRGRTSNLYVLDFHAVADGGRSSEQPPPPGGGPAGGDATNRRGAAGHIDGRTVREPSRGTVDAREEADEEADFSILPSALSAPLRQAANAKGAIVDPVAVKRACEAYPDRDHIEQAERFAAWHGKGGNGENATLRNVALAFRNWLKTAPTAEPGKVRELRPDDPPPDPEAMAAGLAEVESAWPKALETLRGQLPASSLALYVEPLRPAGRIDGTVYLTGERGARTWAERRYRRMIAAALEPELGAVEVAFVEQADAEEAA